MPYYMQEIQLHSNALIQRIQQLENQVDQNNYILRERERQMNHCIEELREHHSGQLSLLKNQLEEKTQLLQYFQCRLDAIQEELKRSPSVDAFLTEMVAYRACLETVYRIVDEMETTYKWAPAVTVAS